MSLWADGEAHASLTATEMLYLTLGYDWLLFGHLLADRSQKGEDILLFCFYFLSLMEGPEFSLAVMVRQRKATWKSLLTIDRIGARLPRGKPLLPPMTKMPPQRCRTTRLICEYILMVLNREHHEKSAAVPVPRSQAQDINGRHHREPSDEVI